MAQQTETLSYKIDDFIRYREKNTNMPQDILPYCYNNKEFGKPNISQYIEYMKVISENVTKGINTNDVIFKNDVKYLVNTINKKNYSDALNKLRSLNYTSRENVQFLTHELIVCTMRCPMGIKGIHKEKNLRNKALSEVLSDVIKYFCNNLTKENNNGIGFHDELLKMCRKFFMDFICLTKSMDQNNENTSDNYKGFMTMMGLMYENNLLPHKIVMECIDSIKRTIFCSKISKHSEQIINELTEQHDKMFGYNRKNFCDELYNTIIYFDTDNELVKDERDRYVCYRNSTECINYYKGYENFAHHYVSLFNHKLYDFNKNLNNINKILVNINNKNAEIIDIYFEENNLEKMSDNIEENINILNKHYNEQKTILLKQIEKYAGFLNLFINSHEKITNLNELYKIRNKELLVNPLKQHIMILHDEITQQLHKLHDDVNNLLKNNQ
jgi:hypothetical protein